MASNMLAEAWGPTLPDVLDVGTFKNCCLRTLELYHDREALVSWHQSPDLFVSLVTQKDKSREGKRGLRLTYGQLHEVALCLASALVENGHRVGDGIAIFPTLAAEPMIVQWAAALLESPYIPLDPRLADNEEELNHCLTISKPSTILACDDIIAQKLKNTGALHHTKLKLTITPGAPDGWQPIISLMRNTKQILQIEQDLEKSKERNLATILFTSGTTSLPKGCPYTNEKMAEMMNTMAPSFECDGRLLQVYPLVHAGGVLVGTGALICGLTVVMVSSTFNPRLSVQALFEEEITRIGMVPSMLLAMKDFEPDERLKSRGNLRVNLAATMVFPEHLQLARDHLHATMVSAPYAMSEAMPGTLTPEGTTIDAIVHEGMVTNGWPCYNTRIKICEPGKREPLKRGETGELHHCSRRVISGYLGGAVGSFYDDEHGHWIATGDAATMLEDGRILVNGRYKDIIIRGGRNIAPAMIENAIRAMTGTDVQVLGVQDAISGEVPVAVTPDTHSPEEKSAIQECVLSKLGPRYALSDIIALNELGLKQYPKTTSGKVQKVKVAIIVQDYLNKRSDAQNIPESQSDIHLIREVWSRVLGIAPDHLRDDLDLRKLADSLTTMQFRSQLNKLKGRSLNNDQLVENYTIAAQAKLLQQRNQDGLKAAVFFTKSREGPPSIGDIVMTHGSMTRFEGLKSQISGALRANSFQWDKHVEDLLPVADMHHIYARPLRPRSFNHRHAFLSKSTVYEMRDAVAGTIKSHRMSRSYGVFVDGEPVHVILRADQELLKQAILVTEPVLDASEVSRIYIDDCSRGVAFFPGLLNKFIIVPISSNNSVALVWIGQHSTFDGTSIALFFSTLSDNLQHRQHMPSQVVNSKLWADMYYSYRFSIQASESIAVFKSRVKDLSRMKASLWPPLKARGYFTGDDSGWLDPVSLTLGDPSSRALLDTDRNVYMDLPADIVAPWNHGVTHAFPIPSLGSLRSDHGIHPVTVVQSSLALAIAVATHTTAALYANIYAARSWPFLLPQIASELPDAIGVDGPTFNVLPISTVIDPSDSVMTFLAAQQEDAQAISRHVHVPLLRLKEELSPEDAEVLESVFHRHLFNWLPNLGQPTGPMENHHLKKIHAIHHNDMVLAWNAGLAKDNVVVLHGDFDRAQLDSQTVQQFIRLWRSAIEFVADPRHRGTALSEWLSDNRDAPRTNGVNGHV